ncbi:MAG TPA: aconitate hydratase AcnA [Gammaproteobacteria bacterium]|nr:aconitate hydratase AcnA [Gammaproteobacteria bacterium]
MSKNTFQARQLLSLRQQQYEMFNIQALKSRGDVASLPFSLKILLENLLRHEDGIAVTAGDIEALLRWDPAAQPQTEIAFTPARVLLQDFTGVPAVVDLAVMRDAMVDLGGNPDRINPLSRADLVIDHSVMVDYFGSAAALSKNCDMEYQRNGERYAFLRWGKDAFDNFQVVPPDTGIVHQVNIEYLAGVELTRDKDGVTQVFPDTLVGTDSHTTMVNGLGVLGWGVGGIEAEAAMLGQPITMLIPQVVGFCLSGKLPEGRTSTDLVLTIVQLLRELGVVGKFVEFFGEGLDQLTVADRATIANMAPEYGATCGLFPVDQETLNYLQLTGRSASQVALVEAYAKAQGMFRQAGSTQARYSTTLELDLATVKACIAGPKRPQDRIELTAAATVTTAAAANLAAKRNGCGRADLELNGQQFTLRDNAVVIAAITSCTNTSNPGVIMGAGLLAQKAVAKGLVVKPWVKTSLAPGSQVVTAYLEKAGLLEPLSQLGFDVVGYGCTTCIGNSGPLPAVISNAIRAEEIVASSVLSGNRNFEGRIHADVQMNFLASPPLVVAYAIAGTMGIDLEQQPLGQDRTGEPVYLRDIWPSQQEIQSAIEKVLTREVYTSKYADVFTGDQRWQSISTTPSSRFDWDEKSTYVRKPPYFDGITSKVPGIRKIMGARILALLGDSITTDHISPAGAIMADNPAGLYLQEHGVAPEDFNSYGSRRGNHEVMMRGTFANIRLRNEMAPGTEGGWTRLQPGGAQMSIFDAAVHYRQQNTPLVVIAGKEYGTGSSRDWAAKGPSLLGVRMVIVESFERIHRSNLVGMGILPLQFIEGQSRKTLGLDGSEILSVEDLDMGAETVEIVVTGKGETQRFTVRVRIDTPMEWDYFVNGGILHFVLRQLAAQSDVQ